MASEITVHVVKYKGRGNLMMRYRCPVTGKQIARSTGTSRRREAEKVAAKWEAELQEGRYHKPGRMGWEEFKERYRDQVARERSAATAEKVDTMFNVVESILSPTTIGSINRDSLTVLKRELLVGRATATVQGYLGHLRAALSAAVEWGAIDAVPHFPKLRNKAAKLMKGRAITLEEFERMLAAVPKARSRWKPTKSGKPPAPMVPEHAVASWRFLLRGLWLSGLRRGDALALYWSGDRGHVLDFSGQYPMIRVRGELEKGKRDRLLPITPDFAALLESVPVEARVGRVFKPLPSQKNASTPTAHRVGEVISAIGTAAGVIVDSDPRTGEPRKFASAHDLRRSFGQRWAPKVMPATLKELMRHSSIETTMQYYVGVNADATAAVLWQTSAAGLGNTLGNTQAADGQKEVGRGRFELPTPAFSMPCSTN